MSGKWARLALAVTVFGLVPCLAHAADEPVPWGLTSHAAHCVIFQESKKTTGAFFIVAATLKTVGKLTVIETTDGYEFMPATYVEDQETMNALQTRALHEHLRYVKIPEHHSPELLQKARDMCGKPNLRKDDASSSGQ